MLVFIERTNWKCNNSNVTKFSIFSILKYMIIKASNASLLSHSLRNSPKHFLSLPYLEVEHREPYKQQEWVERTIIAVKVF